MFRILRPWKMEVHSHTPLHPPDTQNCHPGSDERCIQPDILPLTADRGRCLGKEHKNRVCAE